MLKLSSVATIALLLISTALIINVSEETTAGIVLPSFAGGDGTAGNPYRISNVTELQWMGNTSNLDKHFVLVNDIDASATAGWNSGAGFVPVGTNANRFTGILDGNHHVIDGLFINSPSASRVGLFGTIDTTGVTRNLTLTNVNITGKAMVGAVAGTNNGLVADSRITGDVTGNTSVGGLIGRIDNGMVSGSEASGNVSGETSVGGLVGWNNCGLINSSFTSGMVRGTGYVGGLVGINTRGTISDSHSTSHVAGEENAGGLAGFNNAGTVSDCHATGNVSGTSKVGGLLGYCNNGDTRDSYALGSVSGTEEVGGLIGNNYYAPAIMCYADGNVTGTGTRVGGLVGYNVGSTAIILHSYAAGNVTGKDEVGGLVGRHYYPLISNCYARGNVSRSSGSTGTYFGGLFGQNYQAPVHNCYSTGWVRYEGAPDPTDKGVCGFVNTGGDYEMIGIVWDTQSSLQTSTAGSATGKTTAQMKTKSTFSDLGWDLLYTWSVEGDYPILWWQTDIGNENNPFIIHDLMELQGMRNNTLAHYALGSDIDASATSYWNGGEGFIPVGTATVPFEGSLDGRDRTISDLVINRSDENSQALFGSLRENGLIRDLSLRSCNVSGRGYVGGLVGYMKGGKIEGPDVSGIVKGDYRVGGLVGENHASIFGCSASCHVYGTGDYIGGIAGLNQGMMDECLSNGTVEGGTGTGGLIGYNSGSLLHSYYTGNVTGTTWVGGLVGAGEGSIKSSHYDIDSVMINGDHHLSRGGLFHDQYVDWFSHGFSLDIEDYNATLPLRDGYHEIENGAGLKDLLGFSEEDGYRFRLGGDIDLSGEPGLFVPCFSASEFSGNGHRILYMVLDQSFIRDLGFFGIIGPGSNVTDLNLMGCEVTGENRIGQVAGYNQGTISNVQAVGTTAGTSVTGSAGGLVGYNQGLITRCFATGSTSGTGEVGGLVGMNDGTISHCYATGSVTGPTSGSGKTGGLVGYNDHGEITTSYATGATTGHGDVGGLVGSNRIGWVKECYAAGLTDGTGDVGGLIGQQDMGYVVDSFYDTQATGQSSTSGGGEGKTTSEMMWSYTFLSAGWDIAQKEYYAGEDWFIDEFEDYPRLDFEYVDPLAPFADAGADRTIDMGDNIIFNGTGSEDNIGIVNYTWTFTDKVPVTLYGMTPSYRFYRPGTFSIKLKVTDGAGLWDMDTMTVIVRDIQKPVARAGPNRTVQAGQVAIIDGSGSTDNINIEDWVWTFNDGLDNITLKGIPTMWWIFNVPGDFVINLNVSDAAGNWHTDTVTVTVTSTNAAPVIITADELEAVEGAPYYVEYDAMDVDGDDLTWSVDTNATWLTMNAAGTLSGTPEPGIFSVNVTVSDGNGGTDHTAFILTAYADSNGNGIPDHRDPEFLTSTVWVNETVWNNQTIWNNKTIPEYHNTTVWNNQTVTRYDNTTHNETGSDDKGMDSVTIAGFGLMLVLIIVLIAIIVMISSKRKKNELLEE